MGSRRALLLFAVILLAVSFAPVSDASAQRIFQRSGSIYGSVGYSMDWFFPSRIKVRQEEQGNDYTMSKVRATNAAQTSISALQLSYRIGYLYNFEQTWGIELSFDPVNYTVKDNAIVKVKGTMNNAKVNQNMTFAAANGYYYNYSGANFLRINLVRRIQVFNNDANTIRVDVMAKGGIGPSLAHTVNNFATNPLSGPLLRFSGYNAGVELGVRGTFFRYGYLEIMGRYGGAYMNNVNIYDGTAKHLFHGYGAVASLGFHFPTTRLNPLFRKERKIVTILPFYQQDKLTKGENENKRADSGDHSMFREVPEFEDIVDKEAEEAAAWELKLHPPDTFNNMDSIAAVEAQRLADSTVLADSLIRQDSIDHIYDSLNSKKERKRRKRAGADSVNAAKAMQDSLDKAMQAELNQSNPDAPAPAVDSAGAPPPAPTEPAEEKMSKKDEKKKAKADKKEAKRKAKEEEEEAKRKAKEEAEAKKKAEEEEAKRKAEEEKPKEEAPPEPKKDGE